MSNEFERLDAGYQRGGVDGTLEELCNQLREQKRFHELFEAQKMKVRHRLNLPLLYRDAGDDLDEAQREQLENGLMEACREVGALLVREGQVRDGWIYLKAVGDANEFRELLEDVEVGDDNLDQFIEVCLHESLDLEKGFRLVLENYGTCNAITTFESAMYGRPRAERSLGATLLVNHVYDELKDNIAGHIERIDKTKPEGKSIHEMIEGRDDLTADGSYHLDTTHLSSTVRFARDLSDVDVLRRAIELTEYGSTLDSQLQYPGDPPFEDLYESHRHFFRVLIGDDVDTGIAYFRQKAVASNPHEETTMAIEAYVDLLHRVGRSEEAVRELVRLIPAGMQTTGLGPNLLDLCQATGDFSPLLSVCQERQDLLGYAMALLKAGAEP